MAATTNRGMYVIGRAASYACPTIEACDRVLVRLAAAVKGTDDRRKVERLRHDIDAILERRMRLAVA